MFWEATQLLIASSNLQTEILVGIALTHLSRLVLDPYNSVVRANTVMIRGIKRDPYIPSNDNPDASTAPNMSYLPVGGHKSPTFRQLA